ncbi:general secretion pathway protein GspB [Thiobaca trueperi]|uniref:Type II secretion system protein B n=1 Tax=Thiobaca trueperi TaxID=127458 RepID=A0A4V2V1S4_9GAMM|nr:general secretion pathway protein GspB [Thiobaca trueperi]TCT22292.1 type II secretion system protein B [Thiobaca trueperi]
MSYILEALKKSQQERELGQVPTLDTTGIFSEDKEPIPTNHWGLLAVGLAALAVVIALYAALRGPTAPVVVSAPPAPVLPQQTDPRGTAPAPLDPSWSAPAEPLVEAPPPKRSPRVSPAPTLPGSDRGEGVIMDDDLPYPNPNFDPARDALADPQLELELQRQLAAEQGDSAAAKPAPIAPPERTPIPSDLIDDIEAFKQQVRREQGVPPPASKRQPARLSGDLTRLRLTAAQQAQLPGYLMTVHVYDPDTAKRFVVINTLKYREGEETREGLRVERILLDGAVLSYLGNPFFVPR